MSPLILKCLDATFGWLACWVAGGWRHLLRLNPDLPPELAAMAPARLLVIRPGGLGDMVLLLPALSALRRRFPGVAIDLVCEKRNRDILTLSRWPDAVLLYDAHPLALLAHLARTRYDAVIDTEQFHYFSALMAILARAPARIGFKISPGRNLLYTHLVNYDLDGPEARQFLSLLTPFRVAAPPADVPHPLPAPGAIPATVPATLTASGARLVTIHPGGTSRYKQWAPDRFAELLRRLGQTPDLVFAVVGDKRDRRTADTLAIRCGLGPRAVSLAGRLPLGDTAAVLARSVLYVGGDSGLAHVAATLGVPTVTLFGPSDSRKWGARSGQHVIVKHEPACAPCCIFGYHKLCHSIACMAAITVDEVESACRTVLAGVAQPDRGQDSIPRRPCTPAS